MRSGKRSFVAPVRLFVAVLVLAVGGLVASPSPSGAQVSNPFQRGPAPTNASLEAARGPFAVASVTVPAQSTFGGGTIYYPTDTSQGKFGGIAVSPGFLSPQAFIQWAGPKLASHGFVVFTIDTLSIFDFPNSRSAELQAALTYLTTQAPVDVRNRVDASRLAVMGHSMGGGGTLERARDTPSLQAAVALQPWDLFNDFSTDRVPTLIVGAQNDTVAGPASFAEPFYTQIPAASEKAYLKVAGVGHELGTTDNVTQSKALIVWMKRYVDNDTRYEPFMCPGPSGSTVVEYRQTCPG
jgi:dienelactone hydrolase